MKKPLNSVRIVGLVILIISIVLACQHDAQDPVLGQFRIKESTQAAVENSVMIAAAQDAMNFTSGAIADQGITFGRVAEDGEAENDDPECKPSITSDIKIDRTNPDSLIISGSIIIDFGAGTTCDSTHVRKGKIVDSLMIIVMVKKFTFKSSEIITFQNYWKDSTQVDGTISIAAQSGGPVIIKINGSKIKYHDGSSTSWSGNLAFTYQRSGIGGTYISSMTLTGSWNGTTRSGTDFSANITKEILFKAGCFGYRHRFTPVSGTVDVVTNGVTSTIDYGDGTCDRTYTITTAGSTTEHHLG